MTEVQTPTFLLEDRHGEIHEIDGNARVLVLAGSEREAHDWVRGQGDLPYGRRYVLCPPHGPRVLTGMHAHVVVTLPSFDLHPNWYELGRAAEVVAMKTPNCLRIDG